MIMNLVRYMVERCVVYLYHITTLFHIEHLSYLRLGTSHSNSTSCMHIVPANNIVLFCIAKYCSHISQTLYNTSTSKCSGDYEYANSKKLSTESSPYRLSTIPYVLPPTTRVVVIVVWCWWIRVNWLDRVESQFVPYCHPFKDVRWFALHSRTL